jgi:hypothetical protein
VAATALRVRGLATFGVGYAQTLRKDVGMFFFKPESSESDDGKLQSQALAILLHVQDSQGIGVDLVVARAYWYDGNVVKLDGYIFLKDKSGQWRRNHDSKLVDQVIQAQL